MRLDITMIKNESIVKLDKSLNRVANTFMDMISIAFATAIYEINQDKRKEVEVVLCDMLRDEFGKFSVAYSRCMNKASDLISTSLNS